MDSIRELLLLFFYQPIVFVFQTVIQLKLDFVVYFQHFKEAFPETIEILRFLIAATATYLRFFYLFFVLRLLLYWFPNVNPYIIPYYSVIVVTKPYLDFFSRALPRLFGMDFSFMFVTTIITILINFFDHLKI